MKELIPVFSGSELRRGAVYQIDGCLYEYAYNDPYARLEAPKYVFKPLSGQRRKAEVVLNKNTVRRAELVPDLRGNQHQTANEGHIQLSLF
ncbi:hypothetical protein BZZ01_13500 [Nostocales cyanobacterium HT-58-2]|nr:hypothetical protein BZZ01_13500 [Nostocales cyanobacterium HT-58-2]